MKLTKAHRDLTEPHINASVLRGLQLPIAEQHLDYGELLARCGLDREEIERQNGQIPFKNYLLFMEEAAAVANEPLLGIRLSRSAGPETLGATGFLFLSSPTLLDALTNFCHFMNLIQGTTHVELSKEGEEVIFKYDLFSVTESSCRQDVEFSLALTSRMIQMYGGGEAKINSIRFRHSPGTAISEYTRLLRVETRFNQEENSIHLPVSSIDVKGRLFDSGLSGILSTFLEEELRQQGQIRNFSDQVRHAILHSDVTPPVTAAKVARHLGVSKATLYRRLTHEHTTYGQLLDEVNFGLARSYLESSDLTVTQIGQVLGFAECASFTRAFARWSDGSSPSRYRRLLATGG